MTNRVTNAQALVIVAVALVMRFVTLWQTGDLAITRSPQLDSLEYWLWAQEIVNGGAWWPEYPSHAPGYPFFIAAIVSLGGSLAVVRSVQIVLGAIACVLTARIASRTLAPEASWPAGLLQAIYGPFLYLDTALLAESLLVFLILLAVDLATRAGAHRGAWVRTGLALGAAAIVRPTALVLLVALILCQRRLRIAGPLMLGAALVVTPVVVQNYRVSGVPLIQAYGGMNVYLGNTPASDGAARARLGGWWDALEADASRAGTSRRDEDRYFVGRALSEIADAPSGYARVIANKVFWLTQDEELRDTHSLYFFRDRFSLLAWLPGFGVAFALALVGLIRIRDALAPRWVLWPLLLLALTVVFLVVGLRYRAPVVPFVIALAGSGLALLGKALRERNWRQGVVLGAVAVAAFTMSQVRTDAQSRNIAEEWVFTGLSLQREGDLLRAEEALRFATTSDPASAFAWDALGLVRQRQGRHEDAQRAFAQALTVNSSYALAWYHLGLLREETRDFEGAIAAYRQALAIAPQRTDVTLSLGLVLHRLGRVNEAEPFLTTAAGRGEGRAHFALALTAIDRRDRAAARRHAAEAARLLPGYAPAQELLRATQ